jgi:hypothetical protein
LPVSRSSSRSRRSGYAFAALHEVGREGRAAVDKVRLRLPLAFFNTGAKALIVSDLRLVLEDSAREPFAWITTRSKLRPDADDDFAFATPFVVPGRGTREVIAEVGDDLGWTPAPDSSHRLCLEARVHPWDHWRRVVEFEWWAPPSAELMGTYVAYENRPARPDEVA